MKLNDATILVGDDSILARKQLKDMILSFGTPTFLDAKNGEEAVALAIEKKPDLIFLDLVMPVKDGITAINEIKESFADADIVVVSSVGTQTQLKNAITAGAKDFLQKPVKLALIKTIITSRFEGR
jgi:two-component system chemotaxis response regulator CheY